MATNAVKFEPSANPAEVEEALAAVPLRVTDPERIPSRRYYDQQFFDLEKEKLWFRTWQMAARLEEIPNVGDYMEYRILDKSVIIVNTKNGVKAFHNACRHRGVQLVPDGESGNCKTRGFICPFHGWRWNNEGENTFVFGKQIFSEEALDKAELNLVPCRLETAVGCAFINFDDDALGLRETMGTVLDRGEERGMDKLKMRWWYGTVLPTNWKLAMEAFMEGYHVMRTHPQLMVMATLDGRFGQDMGVKRPSPPSVKEFVDMFILGLERLSAGMGGQVSQRELDVLYDIRDMELPETIEQAAGVLTQRFFEEVTKRGRADGLPVPDLNEMFKNTHYNVEFFFPHFFTVPSFSAMSSYRIRPLTAETCFFEIWNLDFLKEGEVETPKAPTILPYDSKEFPEIPQQDYSNLPRQQLGLHAKGFDYMRLSHEYEGMISNYQRLIDGYLAGLDPQLLAAGNRAVNQGYDSPIVDIGF
ncbi:aromatic ring-hydroxylating oxygenase subunit alpha [Sphingobium tyrosinilyticum]|uniref:Rieske 2Fe-2S domain-containing protein n=1 Tax=Sphingobium tyrosinilyticum TaxID=2715436 RepID=A0ABV9F4K2_9SPHN